MLSQEFSTVFGLQFNEKNSIKEFSKIFKTSLRNLATSSFLVMLQPVKSKLVIPGKKYFFEISRKVSFQSIQNACGRVSNRVVECRHFLCYFNKKGFHHRCSPSNFEKSGNNKENTFAMVSLFRVVIGDRWTGRLKLLKKNSIEDIFLGIFQNFQANSFSEHPLQIG